MSSVGSDGTFLLLEQFSGQPARVRRVSAYDVQGFKGNNYGTISGADKPSLAAMSVGASLATGADRELINQNMNALAASNVQTAQANPTEVKKLADPADTVVKVQKGGTPDYMVTSPENAPQQIGRAHV